MSEPTAECPFCGDDCEEDMAHGQYFCRRCKEVFDAEPEGLDEFIENQMDARRMGE